MISNVARDGKLTPGMFEGIYVEEDMVVSLVSHDYVPRDVWIGEITSTLKSCYFLLNEMVRCNMVFPIARVMIQDMQWMYLTKSRTISAKDFLCDRVFEKKYMELPNRLKGYVPDYSPDTYRIVSKRLVIYIATIIEAATKCKYCGGSPEHPVAPMNVTMGDLDVINHKTSFGGVILDGALQSVTDITDCVVGGQRLFFDFTEYGRQIITRLTEEIPQAFNDIDNVDKVDEILVKIFGASLEDGSLEKKTYLEFVS